MYDHGRKRKRSLTDLQQFVHTELVGVDHFCLVLCATQGRASGLPSSAALPQRRRVQLQHRRCSSLKERWGQSDRSNRMYCLWNRLKPQSPATPLHAAARSRTENSPAFLHHQCTETYRDGLDSSPHSPPRRSACPLCVSGAQRDVSTHVLQAADLDLRSESDAKAMNRRPGYRYFLRLILASAGPLLV